MEIFFSPWHVNGHVAQHQQYCWKLHNSNFSYLNKNLLFDDYFISLLCTVERKKRSKCPLLSFILIKLRRLMTSRNLYNYTFIVFFQAMKKKIKKTVVMTLKLFGVLRLKEQMNSNKTNRLCLLFEKMYLIVIFHIYIHA